MAPTAPATEYTITPGDLAKLLGGEGGVDLRSTTSAGGQSVMTIVGVRPGTTAARLGARNGDTVESLNGIPLTGVAAAYEAADVVTKQNRIVVRGSRDGTPYETVLVVAK